MTFDQRKDFILKGLYQAKGKVDKSLKMSIDSKMRPICDLLNFSPNYYTMSSCSGRVSCYISLIPQKCGDNITSHHSMKKRGFIAWCCHELQSHRLRDQANELWTHISALTCFYPQKARQAKVEQKIEIVVGQDEVQDSNISRFSFNNQACTSISPEDCLIELKFEPLLLHVRCRNLEAGNVLIRLCRAAGLKDVGIFGMKDPEQGFDFRICGSCRMAVPLCIGTRVIVEENAVLSLLDHCEMLMEENDRRLKRLELAIREALFDINV